MIDSVVRGTAQRLHLPSGQLIFCVITGKGCFILRLLVEDITLEVYC